VGTGKRSPSSERAHRQLQSLFFVCARGILSAFSARRKIIPARSRGSGLSGAELPRPVVTAPPRRPRRSRWPRRAAGRAPRAATACTPPAPVTRAWSRLVAESRRPSARRRSRRRMTLLTGERPPAVAARAARQRRSQPPASRRAKRQPHPCAASRARSNPRRSRWPRRAAGRPVGVVEGVRAAGCAGPGR